ncbi:hypothetical protein FE257_008563 [Aspergillus nanangensis]|uniref:Uncharacterized protein n=1 Tax=Aspergillus nanangensis TaxID=2582783 RepID=A0AAD4CLH6_ASPNN|nr:hypothetical protein FE257_008563 [Aspergillus nanangensis]
MDLKFLLLLITTLLTLIYAAPPDTPAVLDDLSKVGVDLLTLDRAVNSYSDTPEHTANIEEASTSLEGHLDQTTQHLQELPTPNAHDSTTLTDAALEMKSPIKRYLDNVKEKKAIFKAAGFDDDMCLKMQAFQKGAHALAEALQKKVLVDDVQKIRGCFEEVNADFDKAIGEFL